jgi:DtxR family Mn-dependent transcriptional regulator
MPSENVENYLKSIYAIQSNHGRVTTSSLSERLRISAASVSEMLKKLAEEGSVHHTPYKGVELTEEGRKRAIQIIRRHRLWELFLVKVLKYEWDEIHEEAERLEHITSGKLEQRLDAALGFPRFDPHGDVIPTTEGVIDHHGLLSLADMEAGVTVSVSRVSDDHPDILKYATKLGIRLHTRLVINERIDFDGSLRVEMNGTEHFISATLAQNIFVEPVAVGRKEGGR